VIGRQAGWRSGPQANGADPPRSRPLLQQSLEDSSKIGEEPLLEGQPTEVRGTGATDCDEKDLGVWLGGRDSNPDNVVQRGKSRRRR
jgi:hypothetical protein